MGKYALLLTFGLVLAMTLWTSQGMQTDMDTADSQANRQKTVLARQIAQSVFDRGISELRRDYRSDDQDVKIDPFSGETVQYKGVSFRLQDSDPDGSENLSAVGVLKSGNNPGGVVWVSAEGYYEDARYRIKADVIRDVNGFSAVGVKGGLNSVKGAGDDFKISGLDTDPVDQNDEHDLDHGSGKGYGRPAMQFDDGGAAGQADTEFDDDQVVGINGEDDIVQEDPLKVDPSNLAQEIRDNTTHSESEIRSGGSAGSKEDPAVAAVDGDLNLSGNFHGVGALVVDGDLKMRGDAQWEGIVIVTDEGGSDGDESDDDEEDSDDSDDDEGDSDDSDDDSDGDEGSNCNEEDQNKGHGNDCDNYDEDNPGNSSGPPGDGNGESGDDEDGEGSDEDDEDEEEEDEEEEEDDEEENDEEGESDSNTGPEVDIGGDANVYGSLMMETSGNGSLDVRGSSRLQYSSSALAVLANVLPTMDKSVTLEVSNRSTKMFGPGS